MATEPSDVKKKLAFTKTYTWFFLELVLPVFFVLLIWPVSKFLLGLSYSYERSLGGADLIPVACILLITVAVEALFGEVVRKSKSLPLTMISITALAISMPLLAGYGFLKVEYLRYSFPDTNVGIKDGLTLAADISVAALAMTAAIACTIKLFVLHNDLEEIGA